MAEKYAIYAGEPMTSALAGYEAERSARINRICADWRDLIAAAVPTLSEAQWCAVIDATNGTATDDDRTMRHIWADLADATEISEKWHIDQAATVDALRAMTWPQLIALRETMRRYWHAIEQQPASHRAALVAAGARIREEDAAAS